MTAVFYIMEYIQITIEHITQETSDRLIAHLNEIGFDGFEEEEQTLKAFISEAQYDHILFENFIEQNNLKYSKSIIKETNWNEKWESGFEPVSIYYLKYKSPFVYLRAGFHAPNPAAIFDLVITPKMSFGTGHHATTHLMIQEMAECDFKDNFIIDFGTGTGVLAILAEKMGANEVIGIDNDDWSISNAIENIEANHCNKIKLIKAGSCIKAHKKADVILANINLNIIKENLLSIKENTISNGIVLFSGILKSDLDDIEKSIQSTGLKILKVLEKDNWLLIKAVVQSSH